MILDDQSRDAGREVTRIIPLPVSVSEQARQFLAMDVFGSGDAIDIADLAGWRAMIESANELLFAALTPRVESFRSTIEEVLVGGVPVFDVTPEGVATDGDQPVYLDIHGGALIMGGGEVCRVMAQATAAQTQLRTWSIDYRMPPDHPYPAALDDCLTVYRHLLGAHPPERIVVGGGSAGGNLAAALMLRARDEGLPLPAALVLLTPEADLTESGDTFHTNLGIDSVLTASLADSIALYAGDHDLTDPYLSPLFGDLEGFPRPSCSRAPATCSCPTPSGCTANFAPAGSRQNSTSSRPCPTGASSGPPRTRN